MKNTIIAGAVLCAALFVGACDKPADGSSGNSASASARVLDLEKRREWAASLAADGLEKEALAIYEKIVDEESALTPAQIVGISMTIADLEIKQSRYEAALASLYRAKLFSPTSEQMRKIDEKRIQCFERLGRSQTADRLLEKSTGRESKKDTGAGGDEVLAEVQGQNITRADLDAAIARLPDWMRQKEFTKEQRAEMLKSLVAQRVIVAKAKKLGMDQDPAVRRDIDGTVDQVLTQKFIEAEVKQQVKIGSDEAKLYFEAKKDQFRDPAELQLSHILVADDKAEAAVRAALAGGKDFAAVAQELSIDETTKTKGGELPRLFENRSSEAFVDVPKVFATVGATPAGTVAKEAIVSAKGRHIVKVTEKVDAVQKSFDDVKDEVERRLRSERENKLVQEILDKATAGDGVKLHTDKL